VAVEPRPYTAKRFLLESLGVNFRMWFVIAVMMSSHPGSYDWLWPFVLSLLPVTIGIMNLWSFRMADFRVVAWASLGLSLILPVLILFSVRSDQLGQ
jgi:hypothetical protein